MWLRLISVIVSFPIVGWTWRFEPRQPLIGPLTRIRIGIRRLGDAQTDDEFRALVF
jgi:hypothetical protein